MGAFSENPAFERSATDHGLRSSLMLLFFFLFFCDFGAKATSRKRWGGDICTRKGCWWEVSAL